MQLRRGGELHDRSRSILFSARVIGLSTAARSYAERQLICLPRYLPFPTWHNASWPKERERNGLAIGRDRSALHEERPTLQGRPWSRSACGPYGQLYFLAEPRHKSHLVSHPAPLGSGLGRSGAMGNPGNCPNSYHVTSVTASTCAISFPTISTSGLK